MEGCPSSRGFPDGCVYELTHRVVPPDDECVVVWALTCDVRAEVRLVV